MMMPEKDEGTIGSKGGGESLGLLSDLRGTQGGGVEVAPPKKSLPPEATMMLGLIAASALLLYGLRMYGMRGGLAMADMQIEYTRDQTITAGTQERVMAELARQTGPSQVPAERIHINPFMMPEAKSDAPLVEKESDAVLAARKMLEEQKAAKAARKAEIEKDLSAMVLQGVMQGRVPIARVNGVVVRVGDKVGEYCVVKEIKGRSVVIEADKSLYELHMPDGSEGKPGKH